MKEGAPKPRSEQEKQKGLEDLHKLVEDINKRGPIKPVEDWTPQLKEREMKGLENEIRGAKNFEELFDTLEKAGGLQGSHSFYSADQLKQLINDVRSGKRGADFLTRSGGLREQVIWLTTAETQERPRAEATPRRPDPRYAAPEVLKEFQERPENKFESKDKPFLPERGDTVTLIKVAVEKGKNSAVTAGGELEGTLQKDIRVGESIVVVGPQGAANTSPVRAIRIEGNRVLIDTQTSTYEISFEK